MSFRESHLEFRNRLLSIYDTEEVATYDEWITSLTPEDHAACLADLTCHCYLSPGMSVLDAGAGTGALSVTLSQISGLNITALEPSDAMLRRLRSKAELSDIAVHQGFCDHHSDRFQFPQDHFDVVASRQLTNTLFDPMAAFHNWHYWLRPSGYLIIMDGLYDRDDWRDQWRAFVDSLPLSACRTIATVPYLLEYCGFSVEFAGYMNRTNDRPSTRTKRYMVVARKATQAR